MEFACLGTELIFLEKLRSSLKEPLVHFLLAGIVLFAFFVWRGEGGDPESRTITITETRIEGLVEQWVKTWGRQPTPGELDGIIRDFVKEEVYYREGLRLGLDQDDAIIRRRIRTKMEFLASSEIENETPTDVELQAVLDRNPLAYAKDNGFSFEQIYIPARDEAQANRRAKAIMVKLENGNDWRSLGDPISLPKSLAFVPKSRVATDFGEQFSEGLIRLRRGEWSGPIASGFGYHLVRLTAVRSSGKPQLQDVRQAVENDWRSQTSKSREVQAFGALLASYRVEIAKP